MKKFAPSRARRWNDCPGHRVTSEQALRQMQQAREWWQEHVRQLEADGFVWKAERGCYVHPDGSEVWVEG